MAHGFARSRSSRPTQGLEQIPDTISNVRKVRIRKSLVSRYAPQPARHRTTLILPVDLLREAEEAVGSTSATETVTVALRELVARRRRERLLTVDLPDLTPQSVDEMRQPRFPDAGA